MFSRITAFRSARRASSDRHRAYAIGDIHGRLDLLDELLERIEADDLQRSDANVAIVFLGDLIDRGPQSAQVVERLRRYRPGFAKTVFLMGNHEEVLLRIVGGETNIIADWLKFGGAECVHSYGVDPTDLRCANPSDVPRILRQAIPREHLKFLASFADTASFGGYLFVHAGIRPGVSLSHQLPQDLRWIREPFLGSDKDHGRIVVHGHTISEAIEIRSNRIGIDTGAYRTGVLSALGVDGDERWFLQTGVARQSRYPMGRVANLQHA